jgi:c-di-GMP-binding flagellar brake protein YcgR
MSNERRSHVRVRPVPETPIKVELLGDIRISVEVFDVSVGGIGMLREGPLADAKIGSDLGFRVTVEGQEAIDVSCNVRHTGSARHPVVGVAFGQLEDDATKRIRAYVADLLERGAG